MGSWLNLIGRKKDISEKVYSDVSQEEMDILEKCLPFTMTGKDRLISLIRSIDYISKYEITGDIVECGVWKGGSIMAAALRLINNHDERDLYLYDTFSGMSTPSKVDVSFSGRPASEDYKPDWCFAPKQEVESNISSTGYPMDKVHLVEGDVMETLDSTIPRKISILRLDTDWYESTLKELKVLFPLVSKGGIIIIDDYGHWKGAKKAADEYFDSLDQPLFLSRVDYTCRLIVKSF